jgi:AcrR family transcriptional regulator
MQAKSICRRTRPTLTEQARRAQIIAAAMETIAELGYAHASFAQIAKRAGLSSTGLISYHFASKKELDWAVVKEIYDRLTQHMNKAMADACNGDPCGDCHERRHPDQRQTLERRVPDGEGRK